ncbi:MAG: DUF1731 domain-containing protein, partial [Leptospiraceae bacterium]|nr:DUF1731 domain-containing protein [Leptospiraceae bacterium]
RDRGYTVTALSRSEVNEPGIRWLPWAKPDKEWARSLDGITALINLAGRSVDCIKTPETEDQILRSRVETTLSLGRALQTVRRKPRVWIQMSTAHIYGDSLEICDEDSSYGYGLAPFVGRAWEAAFQESIPRSVRGVILRTSFVIGKSGGALPRLALLARMGLGGRISHGKQGMSWIHEEDMNALFSWAMESPRAKGAYIASSPNPESQVDFMRMLRRALGMPIGLPASAWMVRIGAPLLMNTDPDLALYGRYCRSARLEAEGFPFQYPLLKDALNQIYKG